jgi:hypothetical protein
MGEVPDGHEVLPDGERDQHLADYNASPDVAAAHEIVTAEFERHARAEEESGSIPERINDVKQEMFFLNTAIDKEISKRPDQSQVSLREQRTNIFRRYELVMDKYRQEGTEDTKDFLDILITYKDELSELLARLEGESGQSSQAQ